MKTEVYSWRVSAARKTELESEARREGSSLAQILEQITSAWLDERRNGRNGEEAEQAAIRKRAEAAIGGIAGQDPHRSEKASRLVREILRKRYGRQRSG